MYNYERKKNWDQLSLSSFNTQIIKTKDDNQNDYCEILFLFITRIFVYGYI